MIRKSWFIAEAPIAYLPLGTIEWHGEHLPLGSDGLQSKSFLEILAKEIGGIVLPMYFLGPDLRLWFITDMAPPPTWLKKGQRSGKKSMV